MNRPKLKYFLLVSALILALTSPLIAGSTNAYVTEQRTVTTFSGSVPEIDRVDGWSERHYYYRTYEEPRGYVIERDFDRPEPYVREYYYDRPGIGIDVPFFRFRIG